MRLPTAAERLVKTKRNRCWHQL